MTDHQQSPLGGVGGTVVPLTYIRIAWLCRAGGEVSAAAETIPYIFHGRQPWLTVKNAKAFLAKVTAVTLATRSAACISMQTAFSCAYQVRGFL